jgi:hypothetical protein
MRLMNTVRGNFMPINALTFRVSAGAYQRVKQYRTEINQAVLRHQLETRGEALVVRHGNTTGLQKINVLTEIGLSEPYYGAMGGAYRFIFHPVVGGCHLEVQNVMGGFAFFYPTRFDPLQIYLFDPVEEHHVTDENTPGGVLGDSQIDLFQHNCGIEEITFHIPPLLYAAFNEWPWARMPLHAYDFIFTPTASGCQASIRARESSVTLTLVGEDMLPGGDSAIS